MSRTHYLNKKEEFSETDARLYQAALAAELGKIPAPVWYGLFEGRTLIQVEAFTFRPAVADFSQNCDGIILRGDRVLEVKVEAAGRGAAVARRRKERKRRLGKRGIKI